MMKTHYLFAAILVCGLLLNSCAGTQAPESKNEGHGTLITSSNFKAVSGIEWRLTELTKEGKSVGLVDKTQVIFFCTEKGRVTGLATINRYFGNLKIHADGSVQGNKAFGMTRMAGPPDLMQQEKNYLAALGKVTRMYLKGSELFMANQDRSTVLKFKQNK